MTGTRRILADAILTQAEQGVIVDAELSFDADGVLDYVGPRRGPATPDDLDLSGHMLLPGLVNGHTHSAMTLFRGCSDDEGLAPWLEQVRALEVRMTQDDVAVGLRLALTEMLRSGTTLFADMYHWDAELLELVRAAGMRVLAAPAMFGPQDVGFPGVTALTGAETLELTEQLAENFAGDQHIRIAYGPHAPYTCPPEFLEEIGERAQQTGLPVHIHLSESAPEVDVNLERYGATPVVHVAALGLLKARVLAAHGVHFTDEEIELLATAGASVSHNPVSNLKLGSGVARLPELLASGVGLTIGTDSAASNNSLDLFEEIKTASILHRGVTQRADAVTGADVLALATARGATAIGFPETGALAVGKWADFIALDLEQPHATPLYSHESFATFAARGSDVRHVFVGGKQLMAEGKLTTLDEPEILAAAARVMTRLRAEVAAASAPGDAAA